MAMLGRREELPPYTQRGSLRNIKKLETMALTSLRYTGRQIRSALRRDCILRGERSTER
jgi:hypothetical protein